jgi:hypothetical protein
MAPEEGGRRGLGTLGCGALLGKNRRLVADEPVELEN